MQTNQGCSVNELSEELFGGVHFLCRLFTEKRMPDGNPLRGRSVSEVNARDVSAESQAVIRYDLYRTFAVDRGPERIECRERAAAGGQLERT
ncbi:hypothetical protein [Rhodococcus koreensis]|uniref:Uncharacterized protein n=1 Tax=Rhodococcus koreensis TaxID=99653 RepID=A0A1H4M2J1_9NOCA|nr:hypothetical protein [Rhodococcus koreensis]SEB77173.1 hypothetical protein SAMN04490239_1595 [Rhodococcus koreensis]